MTATAADLLAAYTRAINEHDFDKLAPMFAPDCVVWFTSGSHEGLAAVRAAYERTWDAVRDESFAILDIRWLASGADAALCTYSFAWAGLMDGERREGQGRGTAGFRRDPDGWKIVHEHLSGNPA